MVMSPRVKYYESGGCLSILVMAGLCAADIAADELQPELNLFVSSQERLAMEKKLAKLKEAEEGDEMQELHLSDRPTSGELVADSIAQEEEGIRPQRYDGVVLKGDQVLDVWFDGSRHVRTANSPEFQIDYVDQNGRISYSTDGGSYKVNPGEELFSETESIASTSPVEALDSSEAVGSE